MNKKLTLKQLKSKVNKYRDLFGYEILEVSEVDKCTTKAELGTLLDNHHNFIENMCNDAQSNLERFQTELGLTKYQLEDE